MRRSKQPRPPARERDFRQLVLDLATMTGWELRYFTWNSMHSPGGFPDLVLLRPEDKRLVFAELKSEDGKLTLMQAAWIAALQETGQEAFVWKPSDWDSIVAALERRPGTIVTASRRSP